MSGRLDRTVTTADLPTTPRRGRVRAPELAGRDWLNTGGQDLSPAGLRGKVVLLDFWRSTSHP